MANVVQSYIDPQGRYFSGYGYRYDERYDSPGFWSGNGGALAFEMFRLNKGATVVFLQIATSRPGRRAVRGDDRWDLSRPDVPQRQLLHPHPDDQRDEGMEVQYRLADRVITVIARNTTKGQAWEIPRGDLIELVEDPRLKLPEQS